MSMKRPQSFSDSFIYLNLEPERESPKIVYLPAVKKKRTWTICITQYSIHFLFHILLIGFFETLFFFYFVSNQENTALLSDVNVLVGQLTSQCYNYTSTEIAIFNDFIDLIRNSTGVDSLSSIDTSQRIQFNNGLLLQAWMYELGIFILFLAACGYSKWKKIEIRWRKILFENLMLIFFLALYEFAFFRTIVFQYQPMGAYELEDYTLRSIEENC
jgi:hypothetical protein